jgi:hypothetical protein
MRTKAMANFYARALCVVVFLLALGFGDNGRASSPDAGNTPEKTIPQGNDPPGADDGQPILPPADDQEVIPPPPTGDEEIYTQAPNPEAGHEEEVIPPPAPGEEPNGTPH